MMKRLSPRTFLKADGGIAAIEMSFILPFMLLLFFGLLDLTGLISFNRKITSVASSIADLTAQNRNTVLKADMDDYFQVVSMIMDPTPDAKVTVNVYGYRSVAGVPQQMWAAKNAKGPGCSAAPSAASVANLMNVGNDVIVAQACMTYTPYVATFLGENVIGATSFKVEQSIMLRPRSSLQLTCYTTSANTTVCT